MSGKMIINIDIETVPPGDLETFDFQKSPPKTLKDPAKIEAWRKENREKAYRDQAKKPDKAKIVVIGLIIEKESDLEKEDFVPEPIALYGEDEKKVLIGLEKELKKALMDTFEEGEERDIMKDHLWVGYNIRKYDLEAIWLKAVKYKLYFLANLIQRNRFDKAVYDLMEKIQGPRTMDFISFDTALSLFDLGSKTEGVDGSMVYDLYMDGKLEEVVVPYCIDDILKNRELFQRLRKCISE